MNFSQEQIYIVTGASSGIGQAISLKLNSLGASVVAIARSTEKLKETKAIAKYPNNFHIEPKDLVENIEDLPSYITNLKNKYGKFTGLACVAGIDTLSPLQILSLDKIKQTFSLNYEAPLFLTKGFVDRRNNVGEGSSIVFITSIAGINPEKGQCIYGGSKAALIAASKAISKELSARKIRCNCISPGWIETPLFEKQKEVVDINLSDYALGIGQPADVANLSAYLLSNDARWITGQNYILDGGKL